MLVPEWLKKKKKKSFGQELVLFYIFVYRNMAPTLLGKGCKFGLVAHHKEILPCTEGLH